MKPGSEIWVPIIKDDPEAVPTNKQRYYAQARAMSAFLSQKNRKEKMRNWDVRSVLRWRHIKVMRLA